MEDDVKGNGVLDKLVSLAPVLAGNGGRQQISLVRSFRLMVWRF